jgi:hypothetical protein
MTVEKSPLHSLTVRRIITRTAGDTGSSPNAVDVVKSEPPLLDTLKAVLSSACCAVTMSAVPIGAVNYEVRLARSR